MLLFIPLKDRAFRIRLDFYPRLSTFQDMTFQVPILGFRVFRLPRFRPSLFLVLV
jgi:hypothetical protein